MYANTYSIKKPPGINFQKDKLCIKLPSVSYLLSLWENGELRQQQWLLKQ